MGLLTPTWGCMVGAQEVVACRAGRGKVEFRTMACKEGRGRVGLCTMACRADRDRGRVEFRTMACKEGKDRGRVESRTMVCKEDRGRVGARRGHPRPHHCSDHHHHLPLASDCSD